MLPRIRILIPQRIRFDRFFQHIFQILSWFFLWGISLVLLKSNPKQGTGFVDIKFVHFVMEFSNFEITDWRLRLYSCLISLSVFMGNLFLFGTLPEVNLVKVCVSEERTTVLFAVGVLSVTDSIVILLVCVVLYKQPLRVLSQFCIQVGHTHQQQQQQPFANRQLCCWRTNEP